MQSKILQVSAGSGGGAGAAEDAKRDMSCTVPLTQTSDMQPLITSIVHTSEEDPAVDTVFSFEAAVDTPPLTKIAWQDEVPSLGGPRVVRPGLPTVPALTTDQMRAAKREQQRSMIAYSMQVDFHAQAPVSCMLVFMLKAVRSM